MARFKGYLINSNNYDVYVNYYEKMLRIRKFVNNGNL